MIEVLYEELFQLCVRKGSHAGRSMGDGVIFWSEKVLY